MKAISFLGTTDYKTVTYRWREEEYQTELFPEAIAKIFKPEKLFVLVTGKAKEHANFPALCKRLGDLVQPIDIPEGSSEAELWQIFEQCVKIVESNDKILLDITHAFRSIPFIVFAAAAYLRRTKNVTICHIVYGAFEARDEQGHVPVFDLTLLLDLLDWLSGAEFLLQRSDAILLGERLKHIHRTAWSKRVSSELPRKLQQLGETLAEFSKALHLARPLDVMRTAHNLLNRLNEVKPEVDRWAKPFGVILEQVKAEAEKFAHSTPNGLDIKNLCKQFALIEHYLNKGLIMQAVTLAREWVVSWVAFQRGEGDWLDRSYRNEIEKAINATSAKLRGEQVDECDWFARLLQRQSNNVAQVWDWLVNLRNDLAHCGMRKDAADVTSIEQRAKEVPQKLELLMKQRS